MRNDLHWKTISSKQLLKDQWVDVRADVCQKADGTLIEPFYVYGFPDYATAVAITENGEVILERMYRHGLGVIANELPGGCIDASDPSFESAMARELLEETGYRFKEIKYLGFTAPNPTTNTNVMRMFLATGGYKDAEAVLDTTEDMEVFLVSWERFIEMFQKNEFIQSMQVTTILYALQELGVLQFSSNKFK